MIKADIRKQALLVRQSLSQEDRRAAEFSIFSNLEDLVLNHTGLKSPAVIAGYVPVKGEVDGLSALKIFGQKGYRMALPAVDEDAHSLAFASYADGDRLIEGFKGILQPIENVEKCSPDLLLVPLAAFRADGHRIGYGAGHYDRTLAAMQKAGRLPLTIGLAFEGQKFDFFAAEAHDRPLDYIVTEKGLYGRLKNKG